MTEIAHEEEIVEEPVTVVDDVIVEAEDVDDDDDEDEDGDDEEDEDELKDPIIAERKKCVDSFDCMGFKHAFNACQNRVQNEGVKENCTPEYFDLLECRDKCVAKGHLFHVLK